MSAKIDSTCPQCGKAFSFYPSAYKSGGKTHCSRACQRASARVTTHCPQCGKPFWYHRSWPRIYCSRRCSAAVNAKKNLGIVELGPMACEICHKEITGAKWKGRRFCSHKCFGVHLHATRTGVPRPYARGERPDLQKRVAKTCPVCSKKFSVKISHAPRRHCCSKACLSIWQSTSGQYSGAKNFNWVGGGKDYYGPNMGQQRRNARHRDNYTCQRCGKTEAQLGRQLDVHHIIPFRKFGIAKYLEANKLSNLKSLCQKCHTTVEQQDPERKQLALP